MADTLSKIENLYVSELRQSFIENAFEPALKNRKFYAGFIMCFGCVDSWGLSIFASSMIIQHISVIEALPPETGLAPISDVSYVTASGQVFGYYYHNLPGEIGYWLGIPILLLALFRSREQSRLWKFVWIGFLCFTILMLLV